METRTARTDVHRPAELVTEDYEYAFSYDGHPTEGDRAATVPLVSMLIEDGWRFDGVHGGDTCDHCGARLRYVAVMKHTPTKTLIRVGETCLSNRFDLATEDFHRLRKAAQLDRQKQKVKAERERWFAVDEDRFIAFEWASTQVTDGAFGWEGLRHKFVHQVNRYGSVSDRFVRAIMRDMVRTERFAEERAAREAERRPVVEGRIEVVGEVVSVKWHDNAYGGRLVMTVKDDRGFAVWGSVPSALENSTEWDEEKQEWTGRGQVEQGDRVRFTATIEKSDRDETFAFFKRPTKAEFIELEEE